MTKLIIYRHFDSKQALYDAVLEGVADNLRSRFLAELDSPRPGTGAVRALLAAAREDPAAFGLLWRHALREPQFAQHAEEIRRRGVRVATRLLAPVPFRSSQVRAWAAATIVSYLVEAVLNWLDEGDERHDEEIAALLSQSLPGIIGAWADPPLH